MKRALNEGPNDAPNEGQGSAKEIEILKPLDPVHVYSSIIVFVSRRSTLRPAHRERHAHPGDRADPVGLR